ncbi:hypothetical protein MINTM011_02990 [Mycobacterium paraintracellulare]|nr:hypothetical protein MINTM011_02990 [Mycobacterium paraintracellulare]
MYPAGAPCPSAEFPTSLVPPKWLSACQNTYVGANLLIPCGAEQLGHAHPGGAGGVVTSTPQAGKTRLAFFNDVERDNPAG